MKTEVAFALLHLVGAAWASPHKCRQEGEPVWGDIPPSATLKWVPCYGNAECARLEVPMDYEDPDGAKVVLAVKKIAATDKKNYKGPLILNGGGPSNSGVDWFVNWGDEFHEIVGKNFDIIAWDPRSYSRSTPRVGCWATEQRRAIFNAGQPGLPGQYDDLAMEAMLLHRLRVEASACEDIMGPTGILDHLSSTHHVRDIHSIKEALGMEKLNYAGFSYGTIFGTLYATLYPDEVGVMLLDGNIDADILRAGEAIKTFWTDMGLMFDDLFEQCAADERCALHESTAEGVRERFEKIISDSRMNPVFISEDPLDYANNPPTWTLILATLFGLTGSPHEAWPDIAGALRGVELGGMGTAENLLQNVTWAGGELFADDAYRSPLDPDAGRKGFFNKYPDTEDWTVCNDAAPLELNPESGRKLLNEFAESSYVGPVSFTTVAKCANRQRRSQGMYEGPIGGNTSNPILFTNARVDPVTGLINARRNSAKFPGSKVLVYEYFGHSVIFNSPCMIEKVQKYLQGGILPDEDETCDDAPPMSWE